MQKKYCLINLFLMTSLNIKFACKNYYTSLNVIHLNIINYLSIHILNKFFNCFIYSFYDITLNLFLYFYCLFLAWLAIKCCLFWNFIRAINICEWTLSLTLISYILRSCRVLFFILTKFYCLYLITKLSSVLLYIH